jgi:hypothetical protein
VILDIAIPTGVEKLCHAAKIGCFGKLILMECRQNYKPMVFLFFIQCNSILRVESEFGNDYFTLFSRVPILRIYDRWGEELFEGRDLMTNDVSNGWDGHFRNKRVLPGIYVYVASVEVVPGKVVLLKGSFLVL